MIIFKRHSQAILFSHNKQEKALLGIEGMHCEGCAIAIETALKNVKGIIDTKVNYSRGSAIVTFDDTLVSINDILEHYIFKVPSNYRAKLVSFIS
ncbi:putative mercury ion binding protein [Aeropyrum pernix K1]|uniref:Mercury ion binding protein n=1 Tax=Aeropyrum pernix (strain ATCC 700893 / DSM 11879 / JCM 9820 / NBRC 100138 / K1) TaxID=272557 RepID=Q9YG92_AERPE|nr:putative mercury ion binding protein [Aeropyrum pernix K1]